MTSTAISMETMARQILNLNIPAIAQDEPETQGSVAYMETLAHDYKLIKAQIDALSTQADNLKAAMIDIMDAQQLEKMTAGAFTVRYSLVESSRIDTKALKATAPDIAEQFTVRTTTTRFTVN